MKTPKHLALPPRAVSTDEVFWKAVGLISGARRYGNRNVPFGSHRSRGVEGDERTEIMGVWGELATWKWAEENNVRISIPCLVSLSGPPKEVDFVSEIEDETAGLEAKAWNARRVDGKMSDPWSTVNINVVGHERSKKRGGTHYVFSFGIVGGSATLVGSPILHEEVDKWEQKSGRYGDPYLAISVRELIPAVVRGRSAFSMVKWIAGLEPGAKEMEGVISYWRSRSEELIEEIMVVVGGSRNAKEFFSGIERIGNVPAPGDR